MRDKFSRNLTQPEAMNLYRMGFGLILRAVKWDLSWAGISSRRRLRVLRGTRRGGKSVIVCNGPSLLRADLEAIGRYYTFGLNKINLLFEKSAFRPSCIVASNPLVIEQNADFYNKTDIPLFLSRYAVGIVRARLNVHYLQTAWPFYFARDCSLGVFEGYTVTYVAMQLAYHMGFEDVAIVGADHSFSQITGRANESKLAEGPDSNHFDPRYFSGVLWDLPDIKGMEHSFQLARDTFERNGRRIVNCTEGGHLEVFERMTLDEWLR